MNDGNMIQEPPACPVCGLAVEERDPRRGKPLLCLFNRKWAV